MAVRVTKVKAGATQFPRALLLHSDTSLIKPRLPVGQFTGRDCERELQLAIAVVRRRNCARSTLLEQYQHWLSTRLHIATAIADIPADGNSKLAANKANAPG